MKKIYKLTVEPITPVHIGTGEVLTPLDYKVQSGKYLRFLWEDVLESIITDSVKLNEFNRLTTDNNIAKLRDFFHKNLNEKNCFFKCNSSDEFSKIYEKNIKENPIESALQVHEILREVNRPIIAGSSLKGAIRTALLNAEYLKEKKNGIFFDSKNKDKLTAQVFAMTDEKGHYKYDAKTDPLRNLQIGDCFFDFSDDSQIIGSIINIHKNNKKPGVPVFAEMISAKLIGKNLSGVGRILVDYDLFKQNQEINKFFSIDNIIKACNNFFINAFDKEVEDFYAYETPETELITDLQNALDEAIKTPNTFILRVGRWSQVEFVTINELRNPKTPQVKGKKGEFYPYGTSRFVLKYNNQYLPMGWCKCTVEEVKN